jgi:hypothetical protein
VELRFALPREPPRLASECLELLGVLSLRRERLLSETPGFVPAQSPYCTYCGIQ